MIILERPNFPPYVCITCGVATGRKWFVSLDFPLDTYFNPVNEGMIFQCNECWESMATSVAKEAQRYLIGQDPWDSDDYVAPTYDNVTPLLKEVTFGTRGISAHPSGYDKPAELSNPEPTGSDSEPSTTEPDEQDDTIREFREFFNGEPGGGTTAS